jgi:uncharacterized protein DUF4124
MRRLTISLAVLLGSAAGIAGAQSVYKYTDPSGRTVYTDDPRAGDGKAQRVEIVPQSVVTTVAPAKLSEADRKLDGEAGRRAAALDRAVDDIVAASQALREAEGRRTQGVEPLEGERIGRRFRDEYWQRQQALANDVAAAQARLDDAVARRNAAR